jgi:hypothetical protein
MHIAVFAYDHAMACTVPSSYKLGAGFYPAWQFEPPLGVLAKLSD